METNAGRVLSRHRRPKAIAAVAVIGSLLLTVSTQANAVNSTSVAQAPGMTGAGVANGTPAYLDGPGLKPVTVILPDTESLLAADAGDVRPLAANTAALKTRDLEPLVSAAELRMLDSAKGIESTWKRLLSLWSLTRALEGQTNAARSRTALIQAGMFVGRLETLSNAELVTTDDPTSLLRAYTDAEYILKRSEQKADIAQQRLDSVIAERDALFARSVDQVVVFETQRMWLGQLLALDNLLNGAPVPTSTLVALVDMLARQGLSSVDRESATDRSLAWFDVASSRNADTLAARVREAGLTASVLRTASVELGGVPVQVVTSRTSGGDSEIADDKVLVPALWLRNGWVSLPATGLGLPDASPTTSLPVTTSSTIQSSSTSSTVAHHTSVPALRQALTPRSLRSGTASGASLRMSTAAAVAPATTRDETGSLPTTEVVLTASGLSPFGTGRVVVNEATFEKITLGLRVTEHYAIQVDGNLSTVAAKRVSELGGSDPATLPSPVQSVATAMWRIRSAALLLGASETGTGWVPTVGSFLPDDTARQLIGTTAYQSAADHSTDWVDAARPWHVDRFAMPILGSTTCSSLVARQLSGALAVLGTLGLDGLIDPARFGGCYAARMIRDSWALSMHARGLAIDFNVGANLMGSTGDMDPRVVTVMEAFGFRWGGYWNKIDPMHFEAAMIADPDTVDVDFRSLWSAPTTA